MKKESPDLSFNEAYQLALRRVAMKSSHSQELISYLRRKGVPSAHIDAILKAFTEKKWIDDTSWIEQFIAKEKGRGRSNLQIRAKLASKQIRVGAFQEDNIEALERIINKKYPALLDKKSSKEAQKKAIISLLRRGFNLDEIKKIIYN